jgi:hypothetical protein
VLLGRQIDDMKSISSPNNDQRKLLGGDLLFDLFRDIAG